MLLGVSIYLLAPYSPLPTPLMFMAPTINRCPNLCERSGQATHQTWRLAVSK